MKLWLHWGELLLTPNGQKLTGDDRTIVRLASGGVWGWLNTTFPMAA